MCLKMSSPPNIGVDGSNPLGLKCDNGKGYVGGWIYPEYFVTWLIPVVGFDCWQCLQEASQCKHNEPVPLCLNSSEYTLFKVTRWLGRYFITCSVHWMLYVFYIGFPASFFLGRNPFWRLIKLLAENNKYKSVNEAQTTCDDTVIKTVL